MKYNVRTNHQNVPNYVSVKTDNIEAAINYAVERTQENGYPYPLLVETEGHDEICIAFDGCLYQEGAIRDILEYAKEIEEDYE